MQEHTLRFYMTTNSIKPRVLRFERKALFQSTPLVDAWLDLEDDHLKVESITFVENGGIVLEVYPFEHLKENDIENTIEEMTVDRKWILASDTKDRRAPVKVDGVAHHHCGESDVHSLAGCCRDGA